MDTFPQELVDQICTHLGPEDPKFAYDISSKFRNAAEGYAERYKSCHIEITEMTRKSHVHRFSSFRLRYIETVDFRPFFPDLEVDDVYSCRESSIERQEKDRVFSHQIHDLFATLKTIEERAGGRNRGSYRLRIYSPHRWRSHRQCHHREQEHWRTHLLGHESLPTLTSVASLEIRNDGSSYERANEVEAKLDYRILVDMVTRCPNVHELKCHLGVDEWTPSYCEEPARSYVYEYDGPRRDARHDFDKATTVANVPTSLRRLELDFLCRSTMMDADRIHHWTAMPNLVAPTLVDPFSNSLRILSYHLRELTLRAQVDENLFWPSDGSAPVWPNLRNVFIMFHMVSPSGSWYFEGSRGEGRESVGFEVTESSYPPLETTEEDKFLDSDADEGQHSFEDMYYYHFRISPNERILRPFLESFAKAAACMPKLSQAILWCPLRWNVGGGDDEKNENEAFDYFEPPENFYPDYLAWALAYYTPGKAAFATNPGDVNCDARRMWWKVGEWRPDPHLHGLFQQIGRREHGEALREYWDDEEFGHGLVSRNYFDFWTPDE